MEQILIVDDQRITLHDLERNLMPLGLKVHTSQDPAEAFRILGRENIDIVIAGFRMQKMDGLQFLRKVRHTKPEANRILMSDFLDQTTVMKLLNGGLATTFIGKDLKPELLRFKVSHILEIKRILAQHQLLSLINSIEKLPSLPSLYQELLTAVEGGKSMPEIAEILKKDTAIAAKVLHVVNSAFFGREAVSSIAEAAVYLGVSVLKDIVLTAEIISGTKWNERQARHLKEIFFHSFLVNKYVPVLFKIMRGKPFPSPYPSVGIMHDIGKVILLKYFTERYESIVSCGKGAEGQRFYDSELALGFEGNTHSEFGAYFLGWWNFPEVIVEVALFHHTPEKGLDEYRDILEATHHTDTAVNLAWSMTRGGKVGLESLSEIGIPRGSAESIVTTMSGEIEVQKDFFQALL
ncbi:MAG TPA: HDOD domain-containing protein [Spirochaetia bacterium]|nr:HDOD domain-containing protein [Spirochaetia bacterium]